MPKQGMGPIRREQICRAAAKVISEQGFAGTTMRMVAEEAGVSTGMLNHYFANRMDMLEETLVFVSKRQQARELAATEGIEPGERRLRCLIRSVLPTDQESTEAWRVWIAAWGASVRLPQLREVLGGRNSLWYNVLERGLEGVINADQRERVPYTWQLDALLNGLVLQATATESNITFDDIEDVIVRTALEHGRGTRSAKSLAQGARSSDDGVRSRQRAASS
jgi:TetR/AcrR family transcriptional regulator, transcriptional repressor of bet genes